MMSANFVTENKTVSVLQLENNSEDTRYGSHLLFIPHTVQLLYRR